jgi:hypothetical protein
MFAVSPSMSQILVWDLATLKKLDPLQGIDIDEYPFIYNFYYLVYLVYLYLVLFGLLVFGLFG